MKKNIPALMMLAALSLVGVSKAGAQQMVTGRVTSARTQGPLTGALVSAQGSNTATLTGRDGTYSIQAPPNGTLLVTVLGHTQRREPIQNRTVVDLVLQEAQIGLGEVVAVGYGQQARSTVSATDVPASRSSSTVTLRFQLIEADGFTDRDPAIADVEAALRSLFRFDGYRLLGESVMANLVPMPAPRGSRDSWADYQVTHKVHAGGAEYGILTDVGSITENAGGTATVELAVLLYRTRPSGSSDILLQTSVRVPHGQTVVLGSAPGTPVENTIILAVRPQVELSSAAQFEGTLQPVHQATGGYITEDRERGGIF